MQTIYKNGGNPPDLMRMTISTYFPNLKLGALDSAAVLTALAVVESSFGAFDVMRYEPAFGPSGLYFQKSKALQEDYKIYGAAVACSFGPWQILYSTAKDYGYLGEPLDLWSAQVSIPFVCAYLNAQYQKGANSLGKLAQSYNSGGFTKAPPPQVQVYIDKVSVQYQRITNSK